MCGIFGVFNQGNNKKVEPADFGPSLKVIQHRGPDFSDFKIVNDQTGLGHVRLSIIDLTPESHQPFQYMHLTLVYNGEIYNYIELREELMAAGYSFRTKSDTEIIPAAYLHWGEDCVNRFNGMWAFALYNAEKDELFCSRDRYGVKPFNYSTIEGVFVFASEIKSMLAYRKERYGNIHYNAIARYCRETVGAQAKETWFEGVLRLPPAHNLIVSRDGMALKRYWNYPTTLLNMDDNDAVESYLYLFRDAIKIRLRSDVPIGLTLSGGLDSSSIACVVNELDHSAFNTYTATFPGYSFDEYPIAEQLSASLGMHSVPITVQYDTYTDDLSKIVYHLESGHGSPAIFPLWHVARRAKEDITVYLEGQGADELLAGYINSVFFDYFRDLVVEGQWTTAQAEFMAHRKDWPVFSSFKLFLRQNLGPEMRRWYRMLGTESLYINQLKPHDSYALENEALHSAGNYLNKRLIDQHSTGLVNLLHYGDAISMAHSLENRLPFMDYRLVELVFQIRGNLKIRNGFGKFIHRKAMKQIVPDEILNARNKLGFVSPLKQVFQDEKYQALDIINDVQKDGFYDMFDQKEVKRIIAEHQSGRVNHERILFKLLSIRLWLHHFIL